MKQSNYKENKGPLLYRKGLSEKEAEIMRWSQSCTEKWKEAFRWENTKHKDPEMGTY